MDASRPGPWASKTETSPTKKDNTRICLNNKVYGAVKKVELRCVVI